MSKRLLRMPALEDRLGCKKSKIYELIARGELPRPVKIDGCSTWLEHEIDAFIDARIAERGAVIHG